MAGESATYVYCVVKGEKPPSLGRGPRGLAGADKPRVLSAGDGYRLVVASAPLSRYAAPKIDARLREIDWVAERAAEHEAVVEHVTSSSRGGTVVPMKMFTLFDSDDRAVAHVAKMKKTLDRVVGRIAGCDEWGLRILFDEAEAARRAAAAARASKPATGTSFLQRKKQEHDVRRTLSSRAADEVDELYTQLAKVARRCERRAAPNRELAGRVLLDAVFLVPHAAAKKLKGIVEDTAEELVEQGFHVTLTGPWPAYSFIGAR